MPLYLCSENDLPIGTEHRVLGAACPWWEGTPDLIETRLPVPGLTKAPSAYPNGVPVNATGCLAEWVIAPNTRPDPFEREADFTIEQLDALFARDPTKTRTAMAKSVAIGSINHG